MKLVTLTKAEQELLRVSKMALLERRDFQEKRQKQVESFMKTRKRAASEFKRELLVQALQTAGIDTQALANRQAQDQESIAKFIETQKQEAIACSGKINELQQAAISERQKRWSQVVKPQSNMAESPVSVYLESATEIVQTGAGTTSIAPQQNLVHTKAEVSSGGYLGGAFEGELVFIDWHFLWTPPRDGLLNATSFLQMNGASYLAINSDCSGGSASSSVTAAITLTQLNAEGQPHNDSESAQLLDQFIQNSGWDSVGEVQFINLNEWDTVGNGRAFQFPVLGDIPILVTVSTTLYVLVRNAQASLDFLSGEFQLNVPFVFLMLN
jgi:hypothetical protein